ncbi:S41 family peptidase [Frateuria sp. GZRR33]|uniref:S41 family peptidase n=1 Tax=Frateuria sp. GZRR33 TaxID=3351535 RepID=UPI003EDBE115
MSRAQRQRVGAACDRSVVWSGADAPCPVLEAAGERATLQGTGVWTGPVWILADRRTGSASEDFIAWLQQNRVARVLGETTAGAGCGYVDGGTRTPLRASPFDVRMPNCARFLDDGTRSRGIVPDVPLPMPRCGRAHCSRPCPPGRMRWAEQRSADRPGVRPPLSACPLPPASP